MKIPVDQIHTSHRPVRTEWDDEGLEQLAVSIKEQGLIAPVKVRPRVSVHTGDTEYELVYGHRRTEAARIAGLEEIEAVVEGLDDATALLHQIMDNESREDVPYEDKARAYKSALDETGWSRREMARQTGIPLTTIHNAIAWLEEKDAGTAVFTGKRSEWREGAEGVKQTLEIKKQLGDDAEGKKKVAAKVSEAGLNRDDTRSLAQAYVEADTPLEKEHVLDVNARGKTAEQIKKKARDKMWTDVGKHVEEKRQKVRNDVMMSDWDSAVKDFLVNMREFKEKVGQGHVIVEYGKFSPEAKRFAIRRLTELIVDLVGLKEVLGEVDDGLESEGG